MYRSVVVSCEQTAVAGRMKRTLSRINRTDQFLPNAWQQKVDTAVWGIPGSDSVGSAAIFTDLTEKHQNVTIRIDL